MKYSIVFVALMVVLGGVCWGADASKEKDVPVLMVDGVNILANLPEEKELSPADAAEKADHDRRVKLSRAIGKLRKNEAELKRVDASVKKGQSIMDHIAKNPTYYENVTTSSKCPQCSGKGILTHQGDKVCPRCGGDGTRETTRKVLRHYDKAAYQKEFDALLKQQKTLQDEHDALEKEVAELRGDEPEKTAEGKPEAPVVPKK